LSTLGLGCADSTSGREWSHRRQPWSIPAWAWETHFRRNISSPTNSPVVLCSGLLISSAQVRSSLCLSQIICTSTIYYWTMLYYRCHDPELPWVPKTAKERGKTIKEIILSHEPSSKRT
jgi:hypothetical protein